MVWLVDGLVSNACALAARLSELLDVTVLNDVVITEVSLYFRSDERNRAMNVPLIADGVLWMSGSKWQSHDITRISVSNSSKDAADVAFSIDAVERALAHPRGSLA